MNKLKIGCGAVALFLFSASFLGAAWTTKRLTNTIGSSGDPDIAIAGSNIYMAWWDDTPGNGEIYFRKSTDDGSSWLAPKKITNNAGNSYIPAIAISGANIYVTWEDDTPGNREIYFCNSVDGGATWGSPRRLTNTTGASRYSDIAVDGANVYVTWVDDTPGNREIYFRKSTDGGATWLAAKRMTFNAEWSSNPDIKVKGATLYLAWYDATPGNREIYLRKSTDGGSTWLAAKRLTYNAGASCCPVMALSGSNIYLAWWDGTPGNYEIYFKRSADEGATWGADMRLTDNAGDSVNPAIIVSGSNVYVVWVDGTPGNDEIFLRKSANKGATWLPAQRLTNNVGSSRYPAVANNSTYLYVAWDNDIPDLREIYLKYSPLALL